MYVRRLDYCCVTRYLRDQITNKRSLFPLRLSASAVTIIKQISNQGSAAAIADIAGEHALQMHVYR